MDLDNLNYMIENKTQTFGPYSRILYIPIYTEEAHTLNWLKPVKKPLSPRKKCQNFGFPNEPKL